MTGMAPGLVQASHEQPDQQPLVRRMCQDLEKMSLRTIPGENMQTYSEYALGKVEEIRRATIIEVQISPSLQSRESAPTDESLRLEAKSIL
jgi:hypothetical protein